MCIITLCGCTVLKMCVYFNRRSYVGVELVQWLCEQCVYVRCRTTAVRVWQVLLELGVLLSGKKAITHIFTHIHTYPHQHAWRLDCALKFIVTLQ